MYVTKRIRVPDGYYCTELTGLTDLTAVQILFFPLSTLSSAITKLQIYIAL